MPDPNDPLIQWLFGSHFWWTVGIGGFFTFIGLVVGEERRKNRYRRFALQHSIDQMEQEMGLDRESQLKRLTDKADRLTRDIRGLDEMIPHGDEGSRRIFLEAKVEKQDELFAVMDEIDALRGTITT